MGSQNVRAVLGVLVPALAWGCGNSANPPVSSISSPDVPDLSLQGVAFARLSEGQVVARGTAARLDHPGHLRRRGSAPDGGSPMIGFTLPMTLLTAAAVLPAGPLDFKARNMRIEPQERRVVLEGDVQLTRGDLSVTGQHAVAEYAKEQPASAQRPRGRGQSARPEAGAGGQTVQRFTVRGNVHVQRGSRTADGELGVMDVPAQT